ncbi:pyridine nucleotide-disulfide oxidoreductase [Sesbania bispinosa]|nr:pyridine nucleotide-disulfide oxidoreductase [Sesbania bispinosa]
MARKRLLDFKWWGFRISSGRASSGGHATHTKLVLFFNIGEGLLHFKLWPWKKPSRPSKCGS